MFIYDYVFFMDDIVKKISLEIILEILIIYKLLITLMYINS